MRAKAIVFSVYMVSAVVAIILLTILLKQIPFLARNSFLGMPLNLLTALVIGLPFGDWARKKLFGWNSMGERL